MPVGALDDENVPRSTGGGGEIDPSLAAMANPDRLGTAPRRAVPTAPPPRRHVIGVSYAEDGGGGDGEDGGDDEAGDDEDGGDDNGEGGGGDDEAYDASWGGQGDDDEGDEYAGDAEWGGMEDAAESVRQEEEARDTLAQMLVDLDDLEARGHSFPRKFNITSDEDEVRRARDIVRESAQRRSGVAIAKKLLIGLVGGIEWVNHTYDPVGAKLDNFSDTVSGDIGSYEDVLARLWAKYGRSMGESNPVIELAVLLGMAGFQTHMMNTMLGAAGNSASFPIPAAAIPTPAPAPAPLPTAGRSARATGVVPFPESDVEDGAGVGDAVEAASRQASSIHFATTTPVRRMRRRAARRASGRTNRFV